MSETPEERRATMRVLAPESVKVIADPDLEAKMNDSIDSALVIEVTEAIYKRMKALREERDDLLDFLVASGYPFDWHEATGTMFPASLYAAVARRWAEKENGDENSYLDSCSLAGGWGRPEEYE